MSVTEKHTLENVTDNFLGADKSLGDPPNTFKQQEPGHREAHSAD